jgi:hypothetical protein
MIILGHDFVKSKPFYFIKKIEDISNTPSNSIVVFEFSEQNLELCEHCQDESVLFAIIADAVRDVLFANSLGASFIICDKKLVEKAQKLADEYMFDAKILFYGTDLY